ncbi:MAG: efflux RND transporter periplasmic adaptor subunit [Methylobacterium sp.]|uniref:efflux RND transporter periplasmic adaptor subunit n=1 Tax=Methylobacterium sp. TaxID=409 RepID=UPI00258691A4|nr:efflux RND transporter periplasmic adaptor subunit [Methylobacterium sp.]MBY0297920.1 efflux RND transporter periplasmic adaptor subunit [Methylobacterium sp.]
MQNRALRGRQGFGPSAVVTAGLFAVAGCDAPAPVAPPPPRVTAAAPLVAPLQESILLTGQTAATATVDLVARVPGFLREVGFTDGADVPKGQVLFRIEDEPYAAQVDLAQAALDQQQAALRSAEAEFARQDALRKQYVATQTSLDTALAARDTGRGAVAAAQANLKTAQINLSYTRVEAPFAGRMGRRLVDAGNLVGAGQPTKLGTLSQIDQLYATVSINERDLRRLQAALREHGLSREALRSVPVQAGLSDEPDLPHRGHLDFVDAGLDTATGTLQARAVLDNPGRRLAPGLFVRVRIPLGPPKPALWVPAAALGADQAGPTLLVVDEGGTVALRRVTLGPARGGLQVIADGLTPGDRVVTDGVLFAVPGRTVAVSPGAIPAPAAAARTE